MSTDSPETAHAGKVLVVLHEPTLGGASQSILRVLPRLEQRGWAFAFWASRPSALFDHLTDQGYEVDGAPRHIDFGLRSLALPPGPRRRLASLPAYLRGFRRFLGAQSPALVHANSVTTVIEALAARSAGFPALLHVHEMVTGGVRGRLIRGAAWRRLQEVVAVSRASAASMAHRGRLPRVVYNGAPLPPRPVMIRRQPAPFVVGTVGAISRRKGTDLFIAAAERLLASSAEIAFEIVGDFTDPLDEPWGRALIESARSAGIAHRPTANVQERLGHWDAFLLPSRVDPFPIALLEAMASGLPVIGARTDGIVEQITSECGTLVELDDPPALAAAIRWMAGQSAESRAKMGAAGRRRVAEHFDLERQAASLHDAYLSAIGSAPSRLGLSSRQ